MRLGDVVLRRGHLSESALVEVWNTGVRPVHLDRCDICAERALEISHWLEDVKDLGRTDADAIFTGERLTAQRGQILSRLEQLDRPAKVISFPARKTRVADAGEGRRVSPGWLAAAAAAGLTVGVISVELSHSLMSGQAPGTVAGGTVPQPGPELTTAADASALFDDPYSQTELSALQAMSELTPRIIPVDVVARNR
ncbi:MAG TPA: hypothetical protein VMZ90_14060 [Vicinamibacterales bacterium]|nr:hypothetical protein [Vicinamibacterales bacterium]